jgi:hypothetical protein
MLSSASLPAAALLRFPFSFILRVPCLEAMTGRSSRHAIPKGDLMLDLSLQHVMKFLFGSE